MHQKIHVLITFLFFLLNVMAQQPLVMQLTEKEGLPDKEFYNVLEDDKGFIWLAADKGLYRYNGKEFQLFSHPNQVGLSVFSLKKDEDDTIWYTNLANQVFYVKDGEVTLFLNLKEYFSGSLPRIFFHKDRLILASIRTLLIIDKKTKKIIYKKQGNDNVFNSDAFIHNDAICFFDDEGNLITIDKNLKFHQKATKLNYKTNSRISVFTDEISGMYVFMKRYLTLPHEYILFEIDNNFEIKIHTKYSGQKRFVHKIKSIQNELFEASNEGVQIYTVAQETLQLKDSLLKNVSISDMLKDSNGNLWFTTLFEGIYVVPNLQLNTNVEIPNGNTIRRLYKGKDNELLLVGKQKEFYLFHHDTNTTTTFANNNVADIKYMFYNTFKSLYYLQTTKALQAFTIQDTTINFLEDYQPGILKDHAIINKDSVLLATGGSIILTNMRNKPSKNNVEILYNESLRSYSCYYNNITKHSYFGTVKGLYAFDEHFNKSEILHNNNSIFIKDMVASNDGSVWCLSFKNGIYQIRNNQIVKNITVEDGLLSNLNDFIRCDTKNNLLWIAGEKGLQQFNIRTATFQNLTKKQGIPSYEFTGLE
ncbi:hypothetical protein EZY14_018125, partial [Kordia sp. TARA_039_SRF]